MAADKRDRKKIMTVAQLEAGPQANAVAEIEMGIIEREYGNPTLQQQRFAELHRRVWHSLDIIDRYHEQGKTYAEAHERRFVEDYRFEIGGLLEIAKKNGRELQIPDAETASSEQAPRAALLSEDGLQPVEDVILPDGRRKRSYLIKSNHSTLMH